MGLRLLMVKSFPLWITLLYTSQAFGQLSITPNQTAQALAKELVGHGISISNATLKCAGDATGLFTMTTGNLGLNNGIVLTTGVAKTNGSSIGIDAPENRLSSINNGYPGDDADLRALAMRPTYNSCALEFDFVPQGDSVQFDYVFGSEEYISATCGPYNDAFAFFISGPGITGKQNIALVPGTTIPVTINSINSGIPGSRQDIANCTMMGPGSPFKQYYINNIGGSTISYRGFTKVLQASSAVIPCNTYHLKIAIADAGNEEYDSGVFLKGGSLQSGTATIKALGGDTSSVPEPFIVRGCATGGFVVTRPLASSNPLTIKYDIAGTAINGTDYTTIANSVVILANSTTATIPVTALNPGAGTGKTLTLYLYSPYNCTSVNNIIDSATLLINDAPTIKAFPADTLICKYQEVPVSIEGSDAYTYNWSPENGLNNATYKQPIATPYVSTDYVVVALWPGSGCAAITDTVHIRVLPVPDLAVGGYQQRVCINADKQLNVAVTPFDPGFTYEWSGPNDFNSTLPDPYLSNVTNADSGEYKVTVKINNGCPYPVDSLFLSVISRPPPPDVPQPYNFCQATITEHLYDLGNNMVWYKDGVQQAPDNSLPVGTYHYGLSQIVKGCEGGIADVEVDIKRCCESKIFIPDAFTPNGDGRNDRFELGPTDDHHIEDMYIFNRWGQLVFTGNSSNNAWDGTFNGQPQQIGTYFYMLTIECNIGTIIKKQGEVLLIR